MMTVDNWMTSQWQIDSQRKVLIGLEASQENTRYHLVMINDDYQELFSEYYIEIDQAIQRANTMFNFAQFVDLAESSTKKESGCSTCQAH